MNKHGQRTISRTALPSDNHPYARLALLHCVHCNGAYFANSCDVHLRRCPYCQGGRPASHVRGQTL